MILNVLKNSMDYISSDLRNSRFTDLKNPVSKFGIEIHNITFLILLVCSLLFYWDFFVLQSRSLLTLFSLFNIDIAIEKYTFTHQIKLLYVLCTIIVLVLAIPFSVYFFVKYGGRVNRADFVSKIVINIFFSNILGLFGSVVGFAALCAGGYLMVIYLPELVRLDTVPGFIIIQLFLLFKIQAFMAIAATGFFQLLLPYSLHSGSIKTEVLQ